MARDAARTTTPRALLPQLGTLLRVTGARPRQWILTTVAASVVLALLDMAGVAAMLPLMSLITTGKPQGSVLELVAATAGSSELSVLIPLLGGFIALVFLIKTAGSLLFRWWLLGRTTRITALAATELMKRYVQAPYAAHRARTLSVVYRNINDATNQAASVLMAVVTMCSDVLVLVAIMAVLALAAPGATLFTIVLFGGIVGGVQFALRQRQLRIGETIAQSGLEAWQALMPGLEGFRETRLSSRGSAFVRDFRESRLRSARAGRELSFMSDVPRHILEIAFIIAIVGISVLMFAVGSAAQVIPVLGLFATAALRALPTLTRVSANLATTRVGGVGLNIMVDALAELDPTELYDEQPRSDEPYRGDIVLDDVTFRYPDSDATVLNGLSLTIGENRTVAFTGGSGAGKTTVVDLILGLFSPTSGVVRCGGRSISDDPATWYSEIGVVPQDVYLLSGTIARNVAFGVDPADIDRDRVLTALAQAQLSDLVTDLPDGIDTIVGERGTRLSGGQRQRVGLARALYLRPRVLVLDEATSALDNATEHEIAQTLQSLQGTMTIIIVAHRLSTVRSVDHLVHLRDGGIAAQGTFDEVREQDPEFARLVQLGRLE
ncbi:ABC transporter ATP-binding protein [Microbacterium sp. 22303]|uniref:ABC transporter ATP-binding protein n=1 Tax=Microbacterium sp. 22303 TaxID=3453905 RepID=UPI003F82DBEE